MMLWILSSYLLAAGVFAAFIAFQGWRAGAIPSATALLKRGALWPLELWRLARATS